MAQRKTLYNWLTTKYLLIIRDEDTFEQKQNLRFNAAKIVVILMIVFFGTGAISFFMVRAVLKRTLDPKNEIVRYDKELVALSMQVDSLEQQMAVKDQFIMSLKGMFSGKLSAKDLPTRVDSDSMSAVAVNLDEIKPADSMFRKQFESEDYDWLAKKTATQNDLQEVFFFPPLAGIVSKKYESKERHYGVDVVAKKDEPIKAIADGTVILASWTQDSGYVIAVQHKNQIISFYKHNSTLLKEVGDIVKAGDIVSIIGNTGDYTDGPHLHLELWYNGNPVDPEDFVSF